MTSVNAVGSVSGTSGSASTSAASQIEALRKQEVVLVKQLKDVAASSADTQIKEAQQAAITAKIQMIEAQIARLQEQQRAATASDAARAVESAAPQKSLDGAGARVDIEL